MPLWTGAEDGGAAYFGVVLAFSPPPAVVAVEVLDELEPVELLEDPQPAASTSVAQAISVDRPLLIGAGTLA